jgi:hypothetical protein
MGLTQNRPMLSFVLCPPFLPTTEEKGHNRITGKRNLGDKSDEPFV